MNKPKYEKCSQKGYNNLLTRLIQKLELEKNYVSEYKRGE